MTVRTYTKTFDQCKHTAKANSLEFYKPNCPSCNRIAHYLIRANLWNTDLASKLTAFAYSNPSGIIKNYKEVLKQIANFSPEDLPKCALLQGDEWDFARQILSGEKPKKNLTQAAQCALAIKAELSKEFPGLKIKCKSSNFSMGNSVHVSANFKNKADKDRAEDLVGKYQYGHFDGMTDYYEHSNSRSDIPQAKYVSLSWENQGG